MDKRVARALPNIRSVIAVAVAFGLIVASTGIPVLAQETANFVGTILDPDGRPAAGFSVVLKDVVSGKEFSSPPSGAEGRYALAVPVGGRYTLARVMAPDGSALPVQSIPPLSVQTAGTNRLDVAFQRSVPAPPAPGARAQQKPPKEEEDRDRGVPWYKTPGGITGIVLGIGAVAALAIAGGDDDENPPVSPSTSGK